MQRSRSGQILCGSGLDYAMEGGKAALLSLNAFSNFRYMQRTSSCQQGASLEAIDRFVIGPCVQSNMNESGRWLR